jgi:hypothetical protein
MKLAFRYLLATVVLLLLAVVIRWSYTHTSLYKTRVVATRICAAIEPGMDIEQLEQLAVGEAGSFVQVTRDFGIASKSFCRCGVYLDHQQVAGDQHPVWCLN